MRICYLTVLIVLSQTIYGQFSERKVISQPALGGASEGRIELADLNMDGALDIVNYWDGTIAGWNKSFIEIRLNNGDGLFPLTQTLEFTDDYIEDLVCADFDGDGDLDIIAKIHPGLQEIVWFENEAGGWFSEHQILLGHPQDANQILLEDMNSDGLLDVVKSRPNGSGWLAWNENLGGTFGLSDTLNDSIGSFYIAVSDIDLDGDNDIVAVDNTRDVISLFENLGSGNFGNEQIVYAGSDSYDKIVAVDMNGDLLPELVVSDYSGNQIFTLDNLGGLNFNVPFSIGALWNPLDFQVRDFDHDNDLDFIVLSSVSPAEIWLIENLGAGTYTQTIIDPSNFAGYFIHSGDLNGDSYDDLLAPGDGGLQLYLNDSLGLFYPNEEIGTLSFGLVGFDMADMNNDGRTDVVITSRDKEVYYYENHGYNRFSEAKQLLVSSYSIDNVRAEDINGDGLNDLVTYERLPSKLKYYVDSSSVFVERWSVDYYNGQTYELIDLDSDGDLDIVFTIGGIGYPPELIWVENDGSGTFSLSDTISSGSSQYYHIAFADFNLDGFKDIVGTSGTNVYILSNDGAGSFAEDSVTMAGWQPRDVVTGDFNGDGWTDVIVANSGIYILFNDGTGVIGSPTLISLITTGADKTNMSVIDGNGDGNLDFAINNGAGFIYYYENDGFGAFTELLSFEDVDKNVDFATSDLDQDGDQELIFGGNDTHSLVYLENQLNFPYWVSGKVYFDENQNGQRDSSEYGMHGVQVEISPLMLESFSISQGDYIFAVNTDNGTYVIQSELDSNWNLTSDSVQYTVQISPLIPSVDTLEFGYYPDTIFTGLDVELTGEFPRCNTEINYWLHYRNIGTKIVDGTIHLLLDDSVSFVNSNISPDSIMGQNIYWSYDSLMFFEERLIEIQCMLPDWQSIGDTLKSTIEVSTYDLLGTFQDEFNDELKDVLVCAYDPNDKKVEPIGIGSEHFVSQNEILDYTIRFQNTGNDTAINIIIRDQLDLNLDWTSISNVISSHNVRTVQNPLGEVSFWFDSIMLPDSNVNESLSHGFVKYSISPLSGLAPMTEIQNTAFIYFDSNPPVVTNTSWNTIECYIKPAQPVINLLGDSLVVSNVDLGTTIQWYAFGVEITDSSDFVLIPSGITNYTVIVTDSIGCSNESQVFNWVGIEEIEEVNLTAFPNPSDDFVFIEIPANTYLGQYYFELLEVSGRLLNRQQDLNVNTISVNVAKLSSGVYIGRLVDKLTGLTTGTVKLMVR